MYYCVKSIYRAGGNVTRDIHTVTALTKPEDTESEMLYYTIVNKYFNSEDEAKEYIKKVSG